MISGIYPIRDIRIVEVSGEKTVWNMGSSARGAEYIWSSNSRYVSVSYWGRIWGSALIVDTITMSEQELPGMTELAPMFPDVPPSDNRPDPYVKPQYWLDDCRIRVAFSWKSYDATSTEVDKMNGLTYTEGGEISGIYTYNVNAGEFVVEEDNMSELIFDED
jgi:hypothetical protein